MLKGISTTIDKNIIKNHLFLNRIFFSTLISFLLTALLGNAGFSQTRYVINSGGDWFNAGNWIPSGIPGVLDTAEIKGGVTVTLDSDATVSAFVIRNGHQDYHNHLPLAPAALSARALRTPGAVKRFKYNKPICLTQHYFLGIPRQKKTPRKIVDKKKKFVNL